MGAPTTNTHALRQRTDSDALPHVTARTLERRQLAEAPVVADLEEVAPVGARVARFGPGRGENGAARTWRDLTAGAGKNAAERATAALRAIEP